MRYFEWEYEPRDNVFVVCYNFENLFIFNVFER